MTARGPRAKRGAARALVAVLLVPCALAWSPAFASADGAGAPGAAIDAGVALTGANEALARRELDRAVALADAALAAPQLADTDRAEAQRIRGVALHQLGREAEAEAALLAYLRLDARARLDPALVPPEVVIFFEDVRSRHAAEIAAAHPPPPRERYAVLAVLPPMAQLQNGHRGKGIAIGVALSTLVAANIGTFLVLRAWCDEDTGVCRSGDRDRTSAARRVRAANLATGIAAVAVYVYGAADGIHHYRRQSRERALSIALSPSADGGFVTILGRF